VQQNEVASGLPGQAAALLLGPPGDLAEATADPGQHLERLVVLAHVQLASLQAVAFGQYCWKADATIFDPMLARVLKDGTSLALCVLGCQTLSINSSAVWTRVGCVGVSVMVKTFGLVAWWILVGMQFELGKSVELHTCLWECM